MEKKSIKVCHQVCEGCIDGLKKVEDTDMLNEFRRETNNNLVDRANDHRARLVEANEQFIAQHGGDSYPAAEFLRESVASSADTADRVVGSNLLPEQRVACSGRTKVFRNCGAKAISIS